MAEISNSTLTSYNYNAHHGANLIDQVSKAIVVLFPRGILIAGYNMTGDLLMTKYTEYKDALPVWILDFFEHRFIDEPLLKAGEKVEAIFIASDKYLLVPDEIYNSEDATSWLHKIFFIESNETIENYHVHEDKARYLYTCPGTIKNVANRYFPKAQVMPLGSYQFFRPYKTDAVVQCCISADHVYATVYKNKTLYWHQIFTYQNAEDIAYQINLMCKQYRINTDNMELQATVIHNALNNVVQDLTQYFPKLKYGNNAEGYASSKDWECTAALLQQLYACAS